jgi:hypothetical protein
MAKNCIILTINNTIGEIEKLLSIKERNFDLIVIDYCAKAGESIANKYDVDLVYETNGGFKFNNIKKLIEEKDLLEKYDYFWFPDWDIEIDTNSVNDLFTLTEKHNFYLSQPSLSWDSHASWLKTYHTPESEARVTGFVEIMCPLFEVSFLKEILWTFDINYSGWGLDFLWPSIGDKMKIGIIDKVIIKHTRPVSSHDWVLPNNKTAHEEMNEILEKYNIT